MRILGSSWIFKSKVNHNIFYVNTKTKINAKINIIPEPVAQVMLIKSKSYIFTNTYSYTGESNHLN
jgi:hypothetical protein